MSLFGGDAPDLLRLAEDEARMLGRSTVEPEHLLLAFSRRGPFRDLLSDAGVSARDLHAAIVRADGHGDELLLGRLPRSQASRKVLAQAVAVAAERGDRRPDDLHIVLAAAGHDRVLAVLDAIGINDLQRLVDERDPPRGAPLNEEQVRSALVNAALEEHSRPTRAPVPAFERFTPEARRAIRAAAETAALLEHREVDPFHLLIGCLQVPESFASRVLSPLWAEGELGAIGEAIDMACRYGPHPFHQATGIFSHNARRVVAESALTLAYRYRHDQISSGHLLLATLDSGDKTTEMIARPHAQRLARSLARGLPGAEDGEDTEDMTWIQFDLLMGTLVLGFRDILPPGWTIRGSARSDLHLRVPDSRSESDFQIRPGWIVAHPGAARDRLQQVTQWMLVRLQAAVMHASGRPWPETADHQPATPRAELKEDRFNPTLSLIFGDPSSPIASAV